MLHHPGSGIVGLSLESARILQITRFPRGLRLQSYAQATDAYKVCSSSAVFTMRMTVVSVQLMRYRTGVLYENTSIAWTMFEPRKSSILAFTWSVLSFGVRMSCSIEGRVIRVACRLPPLMATLAAFIVFEMLFVVTCACSGCVRFLLYTVTSVVPFGFGTTTFNGKLSLAYIRIWHGEHSAPVFENTTSESTVCPSSVVPIVTCTAHLFAEAHDQVHDLRVSMRSTPGLVFEIDIAGRAFVKAVVVKGGAAMTRALKEGRSSSIGFFFCSKKSEKKKTAWVHMQNPVTTQGFTHYTVTSLTQTPPTRRSSEVLSTMRPLDVPSAAPSTSYPRVPSTTSVSVCHVKIGEIDPGLILDYELLRDERGSYKYVQRSCDGQFYDVNYYNAHLRRAIPLGRFVDSSTASLAHAIARAPSSSDFISVTPFAAQDHIESLVTRVAESTTMQRAISSSAPLASARTMEDELDITDFDDLISELVAPRGSSL